MQETPDPNLLWFRPAVDAQLHAADVLMYRKLLILQDS